MFRNIIIIPFIVVLTLMGATSIFGQEIALSGPFKVHLDMRKAVIDNKVVKSWGTSLGWEWSRKQHETTLGYYWLGDRGRRQLNQVLFDRAELNNLDKYDCLDVKYVSAGYWHTLFNKRRWKLSLPVESGLGWAVHEQFERKMDEKTYSVKKVNVYPVQAAVYGEWKATRWLGVGAHVGYRHFFINKQNHLPNVNGVYYRYRLLIYMDTLFDLRDAVVRKQPLRSPFY